MNRSGILTLLLLALAAAGGAWFLMNGAPSGGAMSSPKGPAAGAASTETSDIAAPTVEALVYQKAVLASVLAATYGAERAAKIAQIEAMVVTVPGDGASLSAEQRAEIAKIKALLPDNKRERDASYALYFQGIGALAAADAAAADAALTAVEAEVGKAGLTRLLRYIPPIRTQMTRARTQPITPADQPALVAELEAALRN